MVIEKTYGIIIIYKDNNKNLFLLLQHQDKNREGSWSFPKGHIEGDEKPKETAFRECLEETGISKIEILDTPLIHEEYEIKKKGESRLKVNEYFIGYVDNKEVVIQEDEIQAYKWVTYDEATGTFLSFQKSRIFVLKRAKEYIDNYDSGK